jgi:hypothetical protein
MHTLSIEYYEVVQIYRVVVELTRVTACLFIPMKLIDFRTPSFVTRYRRAIAAAGLNAAVRSLLVAELDSFMVSAPRRVDPWPDYVLNIGEYVVGGKIGDPNSFSLIYPHEKEIEFKLIAALLHE